MIESPQICWITFLPLQSQNCESIMLTIFFKRHLLQGNFSIALKNASLWSTRWVTMLIKLLQMQIDEEEKERRKKGRNIVRELGSAKITYMIDQWNAIGHMSIKGINWLINASNCKYWTFLSRQLLLSTMAVHNAMYILQTCKYGTREGIIHFYTAFPNFNLSAQTTRQ